MSSMIKSDKNSTYDGKGMCYDGCSCHNSKNLRRTAKKSAKRKEEKQWKKDNE